jgi:hypothetical protein
MKLKSNVLMLSADGQWCEADLCSDENGDHYFENVRAADMSVFPRKTRRKYEKLRQKAVQTPIGEMFRKNMKLVPLPIKTSLN